MNVSAIVVIPVYRETLDKYEEISLTQTLKIFKDRPVFLAVPEGLVIKNALTEGLKRVHFPVSYFSNVNAYSRLMRSEIFYSAFRQYDYILVAQLDTFVFSDRLDEWTKKGYDYIGAPWIFDVSSHIPDFLKRDLPAAHRYRFLRPLKRFSKSRFLVGNGGFSLRKTESFLRFLTTHKTEAEYYEKQTSGMVKSGNTTADNEDAFWSIFVPARDSSFRIPGYKEALGFAFETRPKLCFKLNKGRLPFGCHGWEKHHSRFWEKHLKDSGYDLSALSGGNIDWHNGIKLPFSRRIAASERLVISGWFAGPTGFSNFKEVFVSLGNTGTKAVYGLKRYDVAFNLNNQAYNSCGFTADINLKGIKNGEYPLSVHGSMENGTVTWRHDKSIIVFNNPAFTFFIRAFSWFKRNARSTARHLSGYIREPKFIFSLLKNIYIISRIRSKKSGFMLVSLTEHMGDIVACEPAAGLLLEQHPGVKQFWVTNYRYADVLKYDQRLGGVITVTSIFEWSLLKKIFRKEKITDLHIDRKPCSKFFTALDNKNSSGITLDNYYSFGNLLNAMLLSAGMKTADITPVFHFDPAVKMNVPPSTIVFHCSSNERQRNWDDEKWTKLAGLLIDKGYNIAEIGLTNRIKTIKSPAYMNYCGALSLQQIAMLIKNSVLFAGIDSGFAHFANAVNTPGVILLGHYRSFKKYMPYSGNYKNGVNADVIQFDGFVRDLPVETVIEKIEKRLKK